MWFLSSAAVRAVFLGRRLRGMGFAGSLGGVRIEKNDGFGSLGWRRRYSLSHYRHGYFDPTQDIKCGVLDSLKKYMMEGAP